MFDINNMSIRQLIQTAVTGAKQFEGLEGDPLMQKYMEMLNQDGKFQDDRFRKPLLDAILRLDFQAMDSLSTLCLLNLTWLEIKNGKYGDFVQQEIAKQLQLTADESLDYMLPIPTVGMSDAPEVRLKINNLIKEGWLQHKANVIVGVTQFAVFLAANKPLQKRNNKGA